MDRIPEFTGNPAVDLIVGLVIVAAGITAIGTIGKALVWVRDELLIPAKNFRDDWFGTPDRPGVPGRMGVPERLYRIEEDRLPNNGSSSRDALDRIEAHVAQLRDELHAHTGSHNHSEG